MYTNATRSHSYQSSEFIISEGFATHKGTLPISFYDPCFWKEGFRLGTKKKTLSGLNILKQTQKSAKSAAVWELLLSPWFCWKGDWGDPGQDCSPLCFQCSML